MEAMTNGGLQPVYNVNGDGDGWGGGGSWWAIMLFFLLAWGGGWGGNRNQEALTRADLCQGFNFNNLDSAVRGVQSGLCDGFYAMNAGMLNGFGSVNQNLNESRFASQQCCCETNRNIDSVKFENAQNTCEITTAIHSEGEATRALITQNEMQKLRDELADAKLANSQCAQNAYLVNQLQPVAKPAYITCSPYAASQAGCGSCAI